MAFADYEYRDNLGYFKKDDKSGPYWLDDSGVATLMTAPPVLPGIATDTAYEYRHGAGWFKKSTGAGPYASS